MVKIISDYGYCFGVETAIKVIYQAAKKNRKIFLTHPLIHNTIANDQILKDTNSELITDKTKIPSDSIIVFSAHGHKIEDEIKYKNSAELIDATCPLIKKRYQDLNKLIKQEASFIFIGKPKHQETIGFISHFPELILLDSTSKISQQLKNMKLLSTVYLIPQTTISEKIVEEVKNMLLKEHKVISFDICPFYRDRYLQSIKFLKTIKPEKGYVIVAGDTTSSNANEIYQAIKRKYPSIGITITLKIDDLKLDELYGKDIYITSATSASKSEVEALAQKLRDVL